jgi:CubicO group peptidase (beta-lactamase class C family)
MSERGARLRQILMQAVEDGVAPGAAAWIWQDGGVAAEACAGVTRIADGRPVTRGTLFDVASLTKPVASCLALRLVEEGRLSVDEVVAEGPAAGLAHVLAHQAGFQAWLPLHEKVPADRWATPAGRRIVIQEALGSTRAPAGRRTLYSDLGYISLVPLLERKAGAGLEEAVAAHVTGPLGLASTAYIPSGAGLEGEEAGIAATERVAHRGGTIQGVVHDDNAAAMGGVSTHAGLFSTARDMGEFAAAVLDSSRGRSSFLSRDLAGWAMAPLQGGERTVLWDTKSPHGSTAGRAFGPRSVGHLGFTGCSIWIDPDALIVAVLLTNRIHPSSASEAIRTFRPAFHDALITDILR